MEDFKVQGVQDSLGSRLAIIVAERAIAELQRAARLGGMFGPARSFKFRPDGSVICGSGGCTGSGSDQEPVRTGEIDWGWLKVRCDGSTFITTPSCAADSDLIVGDFIRVVDHDVDAYGRVVVIDGPNAGVNFNGRDDIYFIPLAKVGSVSKLLYRPL